VFSQLKQLVFSRRFSFYLKLFDESLFTFKVSKQQKQFKCIESNLFASMKKSVFTMKIQI